MKLPSLSEIKILLRSGAVGLAATGVDLLTLFVLVQLLALEPARANLPSLTLGVLVQFFGNKLLAFRDRSPDYLRQGAQFAAVEVGAFLLNALFFHLLVNLTPVPYLVARLVGTNLTYFGFSFPLWRLIFRETPAEHSQPPVSALQLQ